MSIEVRNIQKTFGTFAALRGIDLKIDTGELVALLGPSGSGKYLSMLHSIICSSNFRARTHKSNPSARSSRIGSTSPTFASPQIPMLAKMPKIRLAQRHSVGCRARRGGWGWQGHARHPVRGAMRGW